MIIECIPVTQGSAIKLTGWYNNANEPWFAVFRCPKTNDRKCLADLAWKVINDGVIYRYVNPGFGPVDWCCVTFVSYLLTVLYDRKWNMGSSNNSYAWSPRHGSGWDQFYKDLGMLTYEYTGVQQLQDGDILVSNAHTVIYTTQDKTRKSDIDSKVYVEFPVLSMGCRSGYVKTIQCLLNFYNAANLLPDGYFGPITSQAIQNYQLSRGLPVTGICDLDTINKLLM